MNFSDLPLSEPIMHAISDLRFTQPTPVQSEVIPAILAGRDIVVKAKTGSGKTCAFAIPILNQICLEDAPKALVITPTRELAEQVCSEITSIGKYKKINSIAVYGKKSIQTQIELLAGNVDIVVGTPGRVNDLIRREALNLDHLDYLVLDEADELLNRGFLEDITSIIESIPNPHQTHLFSATMPVEIQALCDSYMREPHWVEIVEAAPKIKEINYLVEEKWKFLRLREIIERINPFSCIIFCNTQAKVDDLYNRLRQVDIDPLRLHGGMKQRERQKAIDSFKQGNVQYLIATDLVARGIHIDGLDLVVNYEVPQIAENYIHRIGRTGRVNEEGIAVTFFSPSDNGFKLELEKYLGKPFSFSEFESTDSEQSTQYLSKSEKRLIKYTETRPK